MSILWHAYGFQRWIASLFALHLVLALSCLCFLCPCSYSLLQVSNKPVSEVTAAAETNVRSAAADAGKMSIFTGDIKIARSATEALKQQLTRNVELLSSLNALLFPQPGTSHSMEFSRCGESLCKAVRALEQKSH